MLNTIFSANINFYRLFWGLPYKSLKKNESLENSRNTIIESVKLNTSLVRQFVNLPEESREERKKENKKKGNDAFDMLANIGGIK